LVHQCSHCQNPVFVYDGSCANQRIVAWIWSQIEPPQTIKALQLQACQKNGTTNPPCLSHSSEPSPFHRRSLIGAPSVPPTAASQLWPTSTFIVGPVATALHPLLSHHLFHMHCHNSSLPSFSVAGGSTSLHSMASLPCSCPRRRKSASFSFQILDFGPLGDEWLMKALEHEKWRGFTNWFVKI